MNTFPSLSSLAVKTSLTLACGLIIYTGLSIALALYFVLIPMSDRAADDMAAFISMVSESWFHLDETERAKLQRRLRKDHQLFITENHVPVITIKKYYPFIPRLEKALKRHTDQAVVIKQNPEGRCCFWLDVYKHEQVVHIGFYHDRIGPKPPIALIGILASAFILILVTTIVLVRRITSPVKKLSIAVKQLGSGDFSTRLPETGPDELASLANSFNRMAQALAQLINNRTILFGGISHDLRSPITRMQLALELMEDNCDPGLLDGIKKDLHEMELLIQQSIELVKGLDKSHPEQTDLKQLIAEMINDYQRQQLQINCQQNFCGVYSLEAEALRRVLINLLDNAFRYSDGKPVEFSCLKQGKNITLRLRDQGPGIPEAHLETVFQPFFRLDRSRSKKTGGSGLGLAIVQQLCDIHGWKIQLFSGKFGGLEAVLTIPMK